MGGQVPLGGSGGNCMWKRLRNNKCVWKVVGVWSESGGKQVSVCVCLLGFPLAVSRGQPQQWLK